MAALVIFGGLPGTGKSTIARALARRLGAVWLRIDTIEQAMADTGRADQFLDEAGYCVAYAVARDNLALGLGVVADSVNPIGITRRAWRAVAAAAVAPALEVEVVCSDPAEHRRRVETREIEVAGLTPPTWAEVEAREYHPWPEAHLVLDTAALDAGEAVERVAQALARLMGPIARPTPMT